MGYAYIGSQSNNWSWWTVLLVFITLIQLGLFWKSKFCLLVNFNLLFGFTNCFVLKKKKNYDSKLAMHVEKKLIVCNKWLMDQNRNILFCVPYAYQQQLLWLFSFVHVTFMVFHPSNRNLDLDLQLKVMCVHAFILSVNGLGFVFCFYLHLNFGHHRYNFIYQFYFASNWV